MKQKDEQRKTIFRRIGGRIVPISVGVGAVAAGTHLHKAKTHDKILVFAHKRKSRSLFNEFPQWKDSEPIIENKFTQAMKKRFGPALKKANVEEVLSMHPALAPWEQRTSLLQMADPTRKSTIILARSPSRLSFLHELGHAEAMAQKTPLFRLREATKKLVQFDEGKHFNLQKIMQMSGPNTLKRKVLISKPVTKVAGEIGNTIRATGHLGIAAEETAAWVKGAKHLRTFGQKKAMLKASVRPLASYYGFPARQFGKIALVAGGLGAITYGLLKKDKK